MGNGVTKLTRCFSCSSCSSSSSPPRRRRRRRHVAPSDPAPLKLGHSFCYVRDDPSSFISISISGAAVSANASTPLSTSLSASSATSSSSLSASSSSFESSLSFASIPFMSASASGPCTSSSSSSPPASSTLHVHARRPSLQWAQGMAGEDRVHVVVSEQHAWVFVGIYDGFNGPDATHFLLTHLYPSIHLHLTHILSQQQPDTHNTSAAKPTHVQVLKALSRALRKTEEAYLTIADNMLRENPELALMGSCVLVMLM